MSPRHSDSDGYASILALGAVAVLVLMLGAAMTLVEVTVARHRAASAADLSALSGAAQLSALAGPEAACDVAARTARSNGAELVSCGEAADDSLVVTVAVRVAVLRRRALVQARAGPVPGTAAGPGVSPLASDVGWRPVDVAARVTARRGTGMPNGASQGAVRQ